MNQPLPLSSHPNPAPPPPPTRTIKPIRPKRPVKKTSPNHPSQSKNDDDDDFFNLASTRKPIQFVSKTLGLNVGSPEPTNASLDPLSKHTNPTLIDLSGDEDSSDPDDDIGNKFLDAKPKNRAHTRSLPTWTKASRIVHVDTSSDDEEESQQLEGPSSSHKRRKGKKRGEKTGTPARAKSRSPTPPPVESSERAMATFWETLRNLTHASEAQRQIYEANHRKEQEKLFDTLMALNDPNAPASYSTLATDDPLATSCNAADYPPGHNFGTPITLTAQMVLDPRYATSTSRELIDRLERPNTFTMRSGERFEFVYQQFQKLMGLPANRLVVTHDHIKLSPFVTPESVRIYGSANLKVYETATWEYVSSLRRQRSQVPNSDEEEEQLREEMKNLPLRSSQSLAENGMMKAGGAAGSSRAEHEEEEEVVEEVVGAGLINLTVRTKDRQQVELAVKPSTTLRSIVKNSLIELDHPLQSLPPDPAKCKIHFDGEDLPFSSTVADHDFCDDDVLDLFFV